MLPYKMKHGKGGYSWANKCLQFEQFRGTMKQGVTRSLMQILNKDWKERDSNAPA